MPLSLHAPEFVRLFGKNDEQKLRDFLSAIDVRTVVSTIKSPEDLMLDEQGRVASNGGQYTDYALRTICAYINGNLLNLMRRFVDDPLSTESDRPGDTAFVCKLFNECLKHRFSRPRSVVHATSISDLYMVTDPERNVIEGFVTRSYYYWPNIEFYSVVADILQERGMSLGWAEYADRTLSCFFAAASPICRHPLLLTPGIYVVNSEASDRAVAVRRALGVGEEFSRLIIDYKTLRRFRHFKGLESRVVETADTWANPEQGWSDTIGRLESLLSRHMNRKLVKALLLYRVYPSSTTVRWHHGLLFRALARGLESESELTGGDVLQILLNESAKHVTVLRERFSHVAYALISNKKFCG